MTSRECVFESTMDCKSYGKMNLLHLKLGIIDRQFHIYLKEEVCLLG